MQPNHPLAQVSEHPIDRRAFAHKGALLPLDIIMLVSEELQVAGRTNDLAAMCLLGSLYAHPIQRVLFRHIHVSTSDRCARLLRALRSENSHQRCSGVAPMVNQLSVVLDPQSAPALRQDYLLELYESLPMLERVDLEEVSRNVLGRYLVPAEEELDRLGTLKSLRSVTLAGYLGPIGSPMLVGLPHLEEAHLSGDIPTSLFSNASPRSGPKLRRLTWRATPHPTLRQIRWVFGESDEVAGGELAILSPPNPGSELNNIAEYAQRRSMVFQVVDD